MRHTAASSATQTGVDVEAGQRILGHASSAMTLDVSAGPRRSRRRGALARRHGPQRGSQAP
nr:hypothetical protein [Mobilicoccus sp.]